MASTEQENIASTPAEDAAQDAPARKRSASGLAGARPARPRDPRVLKAEAADLEAKNAAAEAEEARKRMAEIERKAEEAKKAAEESRLEAERARQEAEEKAAREREERERAEREANQSDDDTKIDAKVAAATAATAAGATAASATAYSVPDYSNELSERDRQLGTVHPTKEADVTAPVIQTRTTDKFMGSLGLFLLRLALAALAGVLGWQALTNQVAFGTALEGAGIPAAYTGPATMAIGAILAVGAVMLVVGWGTRIVGVLFTILGVLGLAFFRFGAFNPIIEGQTGFYGDRDLLATVASFLLVALGAGGWSIDRAYRRSRERKAQRL